MGLLKNLLVVPVVMVTATIGTIGMIIGIGKFFCEQNNRK